MPRMQRLWIPIIVAVAAFGGCKAMESLLQGSPRPSARITGVKLSDLRLDSVALLFDVELDNPYPVVMPLVDIEYALASNGREWLAGKAEAQGTVPAKGSRVVQVPVQVMFAKLLQALEGVGPGQVVPYDAAVALSVDAPGAGTIRLPLKKSGRFPIPAMPAIALEKLEWQQLSFDQARAILYVNVENKNQFPVDLAKLSMAVSLAGRPAASTQTTRSTELGGGQRGTLQIPIAFAPRDLGLAAFQILRGAGSEYKLDGLLKMNTDFGAIDIPYEKTGRTEFR